MPNVGPFNQLRFAQKVAAARPAALSILLRTLEDDGDLPIVEDLAALTGDRALAQGVPGLTMQEYLLLKDRLMGALALGTAIGLILRSESFYKIARKGRSAASALTAAGVR